MAAVMDALATTTAMNPAFAYPVEQCVPPCVVVGYPDGELDFDLTFQAANWKATFGVYYLVPRNDPKTARDALSAIVS
ncbi:MAG: hypothetical protein ABSB75_04470, partial [Candidatus Limnocylindrales bacterium]